MADDVLQVRAHARHIQISPQKARLVVDVVRGMDANKALDTLRFMPHKSAEIVYKLIASAVANGEENFGVEADELYVYKIFADDGPRRKSGRFGGRGRFKPRVKRSAHLTVILSDRQYDETYSDYDDDEIDEEDIVEETVSEVETVVEDAVEEEA